MKKIISFGESFRESRKLIWDLTSSLTSIYVIFIFVNGYERENSFSDFWRNWTNDYEGLFLVFICIGILYVVNYIISVMWIYLFRTSQQLSGRYKRFLIVICGLIFFLTVFRILPVNRLSNYEGLYTNIVLRIIQGTSLVSMTIFVWGLIQVLVLYVIGNDGDS
jgi:uncharacterized membrane protein YesL